MMTDRRRLRQLISAFPKCRVAILGDLMLDRYVWGDVNRISPEAPVPVVEIREETTRFGGAANVAENVASLGAASSVVGAVGEDAAGALLLDLLAARGVDVGRVLRVQGRPTTTKTRIIAHGQQVVRADQEEARELSGQDQERIADGLRSALESADVLIVSDYGKGVVTGPLISEGIALAHSLGRLVCVDPKESHFGVYRGVTAITPNQKEAGDAAGVKIVDEESLLAAGRELLRRLEAECVVVTRGEQGMTLFMRDGGVTHLPTVAREVYDVTGAGDTVVSTLAVALASGATMVEAAVVANHAAGLVIREIGTASVTPEELSRSLEDVAEVANGG